MKQKFSLQFTWLQWVVHFLSWVPLVILVWDYFNNNLGFYPAQQVTFRTGKLALIFLVLSLSCTPFYTLSGYGPLVKIRRPLGLYAFMYASLHVWSFVGLDYGYNWPELLGYLIEKRYILAGLAAFILLIPLAFTSYQWWMNKLGKNWKRLHRLVYPAVAFAILHYAWVVKGNVFTLSGDILQPLLFGLFAGMLLILRVPPIRKRIIQLRRKYLKKQRTIIIPARKDDKKTGEASG
jgi:methionine sulfoxide reductase heme-binding subunit